MQIADIRAKYPDYDDLSDKELADKLHAKHYSDLPKEEFYNKIGLSQAEKSLQQSSNSSFMDILKQGLELSRDVRGKSIMGSINQDVDSSLRGIPKSVYNLVTNFPSQLKGGVQQVATEPGRALSNVNLSRINLARGVANIPSVALNYLNSKTGNLLPELPTIPFEKQPGEAHPGDEFLQGLAEYLPLIKGAKAIGGLSKAGEVAIPAAVHATGRGEDPLQAALTGAFLEGGVNAGGNALKSGIKNLNPTNWIRSNLSPEELQANLRATENTNVPLGRVVESPFLNKGMEKYLVNTPFSGLRDNVLNDLKSQIENSGTNLVERLKPKDLAGHPDDIIKSFIEESRKNVTADKNRRYDVMSKVAEKENHKLDLSDAETFASENAKAIEESPILRTSDKFRKLYNKVLGFKDLSHTVEGNIVGANGKPLISYKEYPTITQANTIANELWNQGKKMQKSLVASEKYTGGQLVELANKIRNGVDTSIEKSGSPELQTAFKEAKDYYKKNFIDVKDEELGKITGKDTEGVAHTIIKPGKQRDKVNLIKKVQRQLPANQKNLIGYSFLKSVEDAEGNIEPKALAAQLKQLGPRQLKELFPDQKIRQALLDFGRLRGMGEEGLNVMFNPKTGYAAVEPIVASLIGGAAGHTIAGPLGYLAGLPLVYGAGKAAGYVGNKLTSPAYRQKVITNLIKNKQKRENISSKETKLLEDLLRDTRRSAMLSGENTQ